MNIINLLVGTNNTHSNDKFNSVLLSISIIFSHLLFLHLPFVIQPERYCCVNAFVESERQQQHDGSSSNESILIQKNYHEFCKIDLDIIEAIQSNQMDAKNVAIFIDDQFDLLPNGNEFFKKILREKSFLVNKIVNDGGVVGGAHDAILINETLR